MKIKFLFLCLAFCGFTQMSICKAGYNCRVSKKDSAAPKHFLDLKGRVRFGKKTLSNATIEVFVDSAVLFRTYNSDDKGYVVIELPLQKKYKIKIFKQGYVAKIIAADTKVPQGLVNDYLFEFTVDLFEEIPELDVSILKFPIAKIFFNTFTKKFDYDYNYTVKINNDVKIMYADYYLLKGGENKKSKQDSTKAKSLSKTPVLVKDRASAE